MTNPIDPGPAAFATEIAWGVAADLDSLGPALDPRYRERVLAAADARRLLGYYPDDHPGWARLLDAIDHANDWPPAADRTLPRVAGWRKFWRGRRG